LLVKFDHYLRGDLLRSTMNLAALKNNNKSPPAVTNMTSQAMLAAMWSAARVFSA